MSREQLSWIQHNRARRARSIRVGDRLECLLAKLEEQGSTSEDLRRIAARLESVAGDSFAASARPVSLQRGLLTIEVAESGLLYTMRARWREPLEKALRALPGGPVVKRVQFVWTARERSAGGALSMHRANHSNAGE